jgi:hypothetical protein
VKTIKTLLPAGSLRRTVALVCVPIIVVLGILGALVAHETLRSRAFNLDLEWTVPAIWSGLLLFGASLAALLAYRVSERRYVGAFALLFLYMGIDEISSIHEHLSEWTGVEWQLLLSPVMLLAAIGFCVLLRDEWSSSDKWLWLGAGACWFVSQVLERLEWHDHDIPVRGYLKMMVAEEVLEMIGSMLFMLTMLAIWERYGQPIRERARVGVGA